MPRLLIHFARYGPYHHARLRETVSRLSPGGWEVAGLETSSTDSTYSWDLVSHSDSQSVITVFPGRIHEELTFLECRNRFFTLMDNIRPDTVAIAGWNSPDAWACLNWCRGKGAKAILMSDTREADGRRVWWKERIKSWVVKKFDGALVAGKSHREYLIKLGMPPHLIQVGFDVVDNGYFDSISRYWRKLDESIPPYFLASNRFIERKNLSRLLDAYARYASSSSRFPSNDNGQGTRDSSVWSLCLLGDGELKPDLIAHAQKLGLTVLESAPWEPPTKNEDRRTENGPEVYLPGFRQIEELPRFYAHAGCFVHPALEEPWGLVINEAMACGLPVLSGNNVGAAEELVVDGVNGWTFQAADVGEMTRLMAKVSAPDFPLSLFGSASARILEERYPTAAFGRGLEEILGVTGHQQ